MDRSAVEAIYPLTPLQQGMLFHTLYAPASGTYFEQFAFTLRGSLDEAAWEAAWERVVERHAVLRTAFAWEKRDRPLQIVARRAKVPWDRRDWRGTSEEERRARLDGFLREDRERWFEPGRAPLMRLALFRTADDEWEFVWSHHHLLLDGWSVGLVLGEVWTLYEVGRSGALASLPEPRPYRDYVAWLQRRDPDAAGAYWREVLRGFHAPTPLGIGRGPGGGAGEHGEVRYDLSPTASAALQEMARAHRVTLSTVVQGAWALLLSRYSGEEDVLFGATVSGRPPEIAGVERMVGLFINAVPVRTPVPPDESLAPWLQGLQARQAESREHEYAPLVEVRALSEVPAGDPLFETLLVFENFPVDASASEPRGGVEIAGFRAFERTNYPLTLIVAPADGLVLRAQFDADRLDEGEVHALLGHLGTLLEGFARSPEARLGDLPLLGPDERARVLAEGNATDAGFPRHERVHDRFEAVAAHTPDAVALEFRGETLTYAGLNRRADRLVRRLAALGVGPESRVAVCLERGPEMVVALLAVLKAGGAYVPVDPAYPPDRGAYVLEDAGAVVVVTEPGVADRLPAVGTRVLVGDEARDEPGAAPASACPATAEGAAYVIYTSGSTGKPKGVVVPHRAVVNFLDSMRARPGLAPDDVLLAVTTLSFDIAALELFLPLTTGARVALADRETASDGGLLRDALAATGATAMQATPATWRMLLDAGWSGAPGLKALCGGEALPRELADRLLPLCGELWNLYGPTETTIWSAVERVGEGEEPVSLGGPIANTRVYLLDRGGEPVPPGVPGELYVGGEGVTRGYLGRPDLTAERFVPDPFSPIPGARLYRTGDRARRRPEGALDYLGRTDHQVKVRGFRVELGEVEAALALHPEVGEAAVVAKEDASGHARLVAYLAGGRVPAGLRDFLRERLPEHMMPSAFVALDPLPRTPNGKTDRRALAAREVSLPGAAEGYVAPRTPEEEIVARAWSEVLGVERVGARDGFFELGGHSLLAMQVVSRVRAALGVEVPLRAVFDAPRLDAFAERVRRARSGAAAPLPPIHRVPHDGPFPLSFAQERLWFLEQLDPGGAAYVMAGALRLSGDLDVEALEAALRGVVLRHESLRTRFRTVDGVAVQEIDEAAEWPLPLEDLSPLDEEEREEAARRRVGEETSRAFDLEGGALFRALLLRLSAREHVLVVALHHAVGDEWSVGVLVRELGALYAARLRGEDALLPDLPVRYADFAAWQREWLRGEALERQMAFWKERLSGAPHAIDLPTDRPRPAVRSGRGALHPFRLTRETEERVEALAREHGATPFMVLLSAWQLLLSRYSGQETVVVGTPVAGRGREETEGLIGFFVNTLALRADVPVDAGFADLLTRVRETVLDAWAHPDVPFERLVDELQPERDRSRTPVFQVAFVLQNVPASPPRLPGVEVRAQEGVSRETAKFDLTLEIAPDADGLAASLEYATDLFDAATADRIAGHFARLLGAVLDDPRHRLSSVSFLSADERARLAAGGNPAPRRFPVVDTLHGRFEAVARTRPEAVAVTFDGESLTYAELDARADRLAGALRARGAGPEVRVGLCVERGLETVVGILGILKAGSAYAPLDPDYPAERLAYLLEDSAVAVLVTQSHLVARLPEFGGEIVHVGESPPPPAPPPHAGEGSTTMPTSQSSPPLVGEGWREAPGWGAAEGAHPSGIPVSADNAAYVIYTSGSTGRPKGVVVTHVNVLRLFEATDEWFGFGAEDVWTLFHSYAFDFSVWELWGALLHGGRVVIVPFAVSRDPGAFRTLLVAEGVTVLNQTPSAFRQLVAADESAERADDLSLRCVVFGGEALDPASLRPWTARRGTERPRLVNMHGITETTVHDTFRPLAPADVEAGAAASPIGGPLPDGRVFVLDAEGELVPVGVPGELYVGGAGVARGYLGRPELTAERFVPDPFGGVPGARLYRSGDRVRRLASGELESLGRVDQQVKVRGFRIEPGEIEAALAEHPDVRECVVLVREDGPGERRLVGYVVPVGGRAPSVDALREWAAGRLPEYMVPAALVLLDALPLTAHGKVDRRALPAPGAESVARRGEHVAPRNEREAALAAVWREVLRLDRVGVNDNFFALGGDSILSIQVIARAARAGIRLTPRQVFQHQTVAGLAAVADTDAAVRAEQGEVTGEAPLTPVQRWFFEQALPEPHHWNQSVLLEVVRPLDPTALEGALGTLLRHHDALRLRFAPEGDGWRQEVAPWDAAVPLEVADLSAWPDEAVPGEIERAGAAAQAGLDLAAGPLLRAVYFDLGADRTGRLLLTVHHLAVDGVSWRILLEDLERACAGEMLPPKTTSFRDWALRLAEHARAPEVEAELPYWLALADAPAAPLPVDLPGGTNTEGRARTVTVVLPESETRALLQDVPAAYRTQVNDVLLAALARTLAGWTGEPSVLVDLEGHGREARFGDVDLSRTVGWFTSIFPVRLEADTAAAPGELLKSTKERLRAVPAKGSGFGLLRYLAGDEARARLAALPAPQVAFNYLGRFDAAGETDARFRAAEEPAGPARAPSAPRRHLLEVNAGVADGCLRASWSYSESVHRAETVERLAEAWLDALRELVAHCVAPGAGGATPSDFSLLRAEQEELDRLVASVPGAESGRGVEDAYPLTPLQQGILFHSLDSPDPGTYFEQFAFHLAGRIDPGALRRAWEVVSGRHAVLRTAFARRSTGEPAQVVLRRAEVPFERHDWRGVPAADHARLLDGFLAADRGRDFDPETAPLQRVSLIRVGEEEWHLVWSHHHILLDGWSVPRVLEEVFAAYGALAAGREPDLPPVRPFHEYVAWLEGRDSAAAESFWREELRGIRAPTPLGIERGGAERGPQGVRDRTLTEETTDALRALARRHRLTLNTLVQGAWALLLSRYSGEEDVVFGATVSGRGADLPEMETRVGLFINTLPVRVRVPSDAPLLTWLEGIQARQAEMRSVEHTPLVEVQGWSGVPRGTPLFEHVLVFENYPASEATVEGPGISLLDSRVVERSNYPFALLAAPGDGLAFRALFDSARFDAGAVERLLGHLETLLSGIASRPAARLGDLGPLPDDERGRLLREWSAGPALPGGTGEPVHLRILERARRNPGAVAVSDGGSRLTYGELEARSAGVASRLRGLGVGPETRVGLCAEPSPETVVGILAILRAGGAYVPLDPAYPEERLRYMLEDSGARVVVTDGSASARLAAFGGEVVHVGESPPPPTLAPSDPPHAGEGSTTMPLSPSSPPLVGEGWREAPGWGAAVSADHLAYVIYTSGSTGKPKGVQVSHGSLARSTAARFARYPEPVHGFLLLSSTSFDSSVAGIFWTLCSGGTLVVPPAGTRQDPARLVEVAAREDVSHLLCVPSLYSALLDEVEARPGWAPAVAVVAGETCPRELVERHARLLPATALYNEYGPTEGTVWCTVHRCRAEEAEARVPIGGPVPGARVYVLDREGSPVPAGVPGEVYVGGGGVARGYLDRPALTAERFVPNPFADGSGARLYRTGDRVRWRTDGTLEFLGRIDHQVKVRGFRVEPGEVEDALLGHPAVREAAVVVREDRGGGRLVAYLVPGADAQLGVDGVKTFLRERVPAHLVPAVFVALDALPRTPNGKVDRDSLPAPEAGGPGGEYVAPRTETETRVAQVWSEVLGVERVGMRDDFFDLGGHSLLAMKAVSRLRQLLEVDLPVHAVFDHPTAEALAAEVDRRADAAVAALLAEIEGLSDEEAGDLLAAELAALDPETGGDSR